MSHARSRARRAAVQALYQWQMTQQNVADILKQFAEDYPDQRVDRRYFDELLRGVSSRLDEIDDAFTPLLDRPLKELDPVELAVLRIATCEFITRLDVPYRVVINEAVESARVFGAEQSHKYINGVLDKLSMRLRATEREAAAGKS